MTDPKPEDLERPDCALCGPGTERRPVHAFPPFGVVSCARCSLVFLSPRLVERRMMGLYQDATYWDSDVAGRGYDEYLEVRENWLRTFRRRLGEIARHGARGGTVLDVGCGPGFFVEAARGDGWDAHGIDPSEYAIALARRALGERVSVGVVDANRHAPGSFDLVTAFDAFEHVYEPRRFLDAAHALLRPGGVLAITTPNVESLLARVSGRGWVSFKIPEHVYYWSPATIRRALAPRFDVLEVRRAGQYATVGFLARRALRIGPGSPAWLRRAADALGGRSVYADNGSLTAIARRRD
jgi:2-polyprenyl-3-methyl-5-hydroxy-6-metoxy-1,4-benzoquinol methylase